MNRFRRNLRLESASDRSPSRLAFRRAFHTQKQHIFRAVRMLAPGLLALSLAGVAHAQGTMDFSGAQTLMGTFNARFAYVSVSRASQDAQIFTNDAANLATSLSKEMSKTSAVEPLGLDRTILNVTTEPPALVKKVTGSGLGLAL